MAYVRTDNGARVPDEAVRSGPLGLVYLDNEIDAEVSVKIVADVPAQARTVPRPQNPMGVARQLVEELFTDAHGSLTLRVHRGDFYRYDGACWPEAEARGVKEAAYKYLENAVYEVEKKGVVEEVAWEPTRRKVDDVLDALRAVAHLDGSVEPPAWLSVPGVPRDAAMYEPPAHEVVAMRNGLLHIASRKLFAHTPEFFVHHALPFDYDPAAAQPARWLRFLDEVWGDDQASINTLQEWFGYAIGGGTEQQKMAMLIGPKRSGKGTIGRVLTGLLGKYNIAGVAGDQLRSEPAHHSALGAYLRRPPRHNPRAFAIRNVIFCARLQTSTGTRWA
jgi:putative DNA primase/helicase